MEPQASQIGRTLTAARRAAGLSKLALAARAGVSRKTITRLEAGAFAPRMATAVALTQALGYTDPALLFPEHFTPLPAGMSGEAPAPVAATSLAAAGGLADTEGDR